MAGLAALTLNSGPLQHTQTRQGRVLFVVRGSPALGEGIRHTHKTSSAQTVTEYVIKMPHFE